MNLIDKPAQNALRRLWEKSLPGVPVPLTTHWSLAFGREVYTLIAHATQCEVPEETIVGMLTTMEVWDADQAKQQWEPM